MRSRAFFLHLAFALAVSAHAAAGPEVVLAWNETAYEIAFAEDRFMTFKGQRAFALMHLAMHDALNAVDPRYRTWAHEARDADADPVAGAAQAAHGVLTALYPGARERLDEELATWLGETGEGPAKARGIALGRASAHAILAARANDGWDGAGTYEFREGAGAYRTTPDWNGFVLQPGFRFARPLALDSPDQFRPPPPPAPGSARFAQAMREVENAGRKEGSTRSADQGAYAIWWMEFAEGSVMRLARSLAAKRRPDLWETARAFAVLAVALYDSYIAVWDSKYEYDHWRPYTAIRETSDPEWDSMRPAPPFPEYVSAHAAGCAASFAALETWFGGDVAFSMTTITAPPGMPSRRFTSFRAAADECADSRVRLGWHFRYATDAGLALGRAIAAHVDRNHLRPR